MTEFTASNGIKVTSDPADRLHPLTVSHLGLLPTSVDVLREFFQDERDREIGRWRSKKMRTFLVYQIEESGLVLVVDEVSGEGIVFTRDVLDFDGTEANFVIVAREYFAAHPEPKPWHDAKGGEVWEIQDASATRIVFAHDDRTVGGVHGVTDNGLYLAFDAPEITAGRRIWPEATS